MPGSLWHDRSHGRGPCVLSSMTDSNAHPSLHMAALCGVRMDGWFHYRCFPTPRRRRADPGNTLRRNAPWPRANMHSKATAKVAPGDHLVGPGVSAHRTDRAQSWRRWQKLTCSPSRLRVGPKRYGVHASSGSCRRTSPTCQDIGQFLGHGAESESRSGPSSCSTTNTNVKAWSMLMNRPGFAARARHVSGHAPSRSPVSFERDSGSELVEC